MRSSTPVTERAALATAEQILLFRGEPATVFYSASCGGRSEKPSNVWPGADDPPYLPIRDDDGCGGFPAWSAELAGADLQRAFAAGGYKGTLRDLKVVSRNDSGRVARLSVEGMTPREISGQDLRMVVGRALGFQHIQSTTFELRRTGRAFRFTGRGSGHGVGLCVIGSMKLAAAGQSASTILGRYFPGTQIGVYGPRLTSAPRETPTIAAPPPRDARAALPAVPRSSPSGSAPPASTASGSPVPPAGALPGTSATPSPSAPAATSPGAPVPRSAAAAMTPVTDLPALPSDIIITVPAGASGERDALGALIVRERQALAQALGVAVPRVRVRAHQSNDAYERASGLPWFTLGGLAGDEIQLAPLELLRARGMLERTVRRQLVHLMVDGVLPARPAWLREGAAVYFADPTAASTARPPCPQDIELQRPISVGALGDGLARARACFERQVAGGRDWRKAR